ncbi:biotin--[acetyl-CoA-carboxylase] ligase [Streptomonospora sp. PA3]|uniref:biotin--[acetyl-CoA-carboxylase] ligase n=1 Tax=Streptomonospora sp. PA3 TaxID=2607326 RepID=UPI0012DE59CE|nr:biotin--[acetyl-CoA-carboxylase] ligase [Streptomonospora sp. PA3]MUL39685.1 biotin--[acetyl-CoA-carboxylase] ligase [Streptomonospora sp. PA3]
MTAATASSPGDPGPSGTSRPPLDASALERALVRPGGLWRTVEVLPEVGSTNSELLERAGAGEPAGVVLATDHQTAGRGRLDRGFATPARAALTLSVLVRPATSPARLGWLPLLMGVAAVRTLRGGPGVPAVLKWPNDVLAADSEHKLAGILSEAAFPHAQPSGGAGGAGVGVVIGIGLNVAQRRDELPVETATSLALCGAPGADRQRLAEALPEEFEALYSAWSAVGGDAAASGLAEEYRACCTTLGRRVRVHLPGGRELHGEATGVDAEGRLALRADTGEEHLLSAGDIVHLRPAGT